VAQRTASAAGERAGAAAALRSGEVRRRGVAAALGPGPGSRPYRRGGCVRARPALRRARRTQLARAAAVRERQKGPGRHAVTLQRAACAAFCVRTHAHALRPSPPQARVGVRAMARPACPRRRGAARAGGAACAVALLALLLPPTAAFYLPGVAPQDYAKARRALRCVRATAPARRALRGASQQRARANPGCRRFR
jgi:hypothetical protein